MSKNDADKRSDAEWKKTLSPEQYKVLRRKGTELAFTGKYYNSKEKGLYACATASTRYLWASNLVRDLRKADRTPVRQAAVFSRSGIYHLRQLRLSLKQCTLSE